MLEDCVCELSDLACGPFLGGGRKSLDIIIIILNASSLACGISMFSTLLLFHDYM